MQQRGWLFVVAILASLLLPVGGSAHGQRAPLENGAPHTLPVGSEAKMLSTAAESACQTEIEVTSVGDSGPGTLRQALDPEALLDNPDALRLQPWMAVWDDAARQELVAAGHVTADEAATFHTGQEWAAGFLQATVDFAPDWPDPDKGDPDAGVFGELLGTVAALAWDPAGEDFQAFARAGWKSADPTRDEVIDEACFAVQELRLWWIDHPPKRPPRRVEATPGRNDPCWCGSGRKFKKCHGAAA